VLTEGGLARAHAVLQLSPRVLDADSREELNLRTRRAGDVAAQQAAELGEAEGAILLLFEHADAGKQTQHAPQRRRVGPGFGGERRGRPGAGGQQVGDAEAGGEIEGARHVVSDRHLVQEQSRREPCGLRRRRGHALPCFWLP
jgi:hypothetical protein